VQQRIGHAAHRRNNDTQAGIVAIEHQSGNAAKAVSISEAAATKLMNFPTGIQRSVPSAKR
jgi:hypothetical protein